MYRINLLVGFSFCLGSSVIAQESCEPTSTNDVIRSAEAQSLPSAASVKAKLINYFPESREVFSVEQPLLALQANQEEKKQIKLVEAAIQQFMVSPKHSFVSGGMLLNDQRLRFEFNEKVGGDFKPEFFVYEVRKDTLGGVHTLANRVRIQSEDKKSEVVTVWPKAGFFGSGTYVWASTVGSKIYVNYFRVKDAVH